MLGMRKNCNLAENLEEGMWEEVNWIFGSESDLNFSQFYFKEMEQEKSALDNLEI